MTIGRTTLKRLFALSGNACALPCCEVRLTDPGWQSVLAEICHIRAVSEGGPRFDPTYERVDDFENLLLLCANCHTKIDRLEPELWPVDRLEHVKECHENRSLDAFKKRWWRSEELLDAIVSLKMLAEGVGVAPIVDVPDGRSGASKAGQREFDDLWSVAQASIRAYTGERGPNAWFDSEINRLTSDGYTWSAVSLVQMACENGDVSRMELDEAERLYSALGNVQFPFARSAC